MYRVAPIATLAVALTACSLGSNSISTGFFDSGQTSTAAIPSSSKHTLGGRQIARLEDKAPKGTYETAPKGVLADRDYTRTTLDPEFAKAIINQYRKEKGLKPLRLNAELTKAAKAHSRDLAKWDRISHYGSDGSNPWDRVKRTGYKARLAAENVGTGQVNFKEVMAGWKNSPGHNKNLLLADAQHMGIALVHNPKTEFKSFWTLVVGSAM
ncbi:MAG: CAP domain-containing protein [Alphaproteobacteria bacterium]|nr:CAP domain-containing protein [Alphaproteobacteria bacterium]